MRLYKAIDAGVLTATTAIGDAARAHRDRRRLDVQRFDDNHDTERNGSTLKTWMTSGEHIRSMSAR